MIELAIGIDIGGTNTPFGLVDRQGKIYGKGSVDTKQHPSVNTFVRSLSLEINKSLAILDFEYTIVGIGIGAPNGNFFHGTIEYAPNLPWRGVINLIKLFNEYFSVPIYVTNDANAATIGEMKFGCAQGMKDFMVVTLGTGLGSGFVANGELIYGHDSFAGELGHTIIDPDGRECNCGRKGCLETYCSVTGFVRTAQILLAQTAKKSLLHDIAVEKITGLTITEAAQKGDRLALEIFDFTAKKLALSLANAVAITSPEAIILFGGLANSGHLLIEPTRRYLESFLLNIFQNQVELKISTLTEKNAAILGASAIVWNSLKQDSYEKININ